MNQTRTAPIRVLAVDDDESIVELTAEMLEREHEEMIVTTETSAEAGLDHVGDGIDCIVSDYRMPGMDGLAFLEAVRQDAPEMPFILFTGEGSESIASEAISAGVTDYVQKDTGTDQYIMLANRIKTAAERKRAKQVHRETEQRYIQLLEQTPHAIIVCQGDEIVYANESFTDLLAAEDPGDIVGFGPDTVVHPDWVDDYRRRLEHIQETQSVEQFEVRIVDCESQARQIEAIGAPVTYEDETAIQLVMRDVSERRRREQKLARKREWFRAVFEHSQDPMMILDPRADDIVAANPRACEMLGYEREELLTLTPNDIHPHEIDRFEEFVETVVEEGSGWTRELGCRRRDGDTVSVEVSGSVVEANGRRQLLTVLRELDARETRERQLRQLQTETRALLATESTEEVGRVAIDAIDEILALPYAGLHVFDSGSGMLEPVAVTDGVRDLFDGAPQIDAEDGVPAWEAYATDEPKIVQDMNVAEFAGVSEVPIESGLHFPVGDEGVLTIASPATNAFDPGDVDLARVLATTVDAAMERVARQQELTLKDRAMDESNIGIVITDPSQPDNPIIYANEGFTRLTGYTKSEVLGENCRFLQGEDTDPETVATMREAIDQDRPTSVEVLNYRKDGTPFWSQVEIMPVRDDEGEVTNYLGFQRGVTERKTREQRLREEQQRLDTVLSNMPVVLWQIDEDGVVTRSDGRALETLGAEPDEIEGESVFEIFAEHPDIPDHCRRALDGESVAATVQVGDTTFESYYEPMVDDAGEVTGVVGLAFDITERVAREQELQRVKERFQRVFEQSTDAIVLVDIEDDELLEVNQAACEMLGYDREELLALGADDIYPADTEDRREAFRSQVRETGSAYTSDVPCVTSRGEIVPTEISGALLTSDATDQPSTMVAVIRDISDRVVYEKELERQNERLEKFASTVAHDLRNPLSVAEGYLKVAQETGETDVLEDLGDAHGRMRSIITDLLTAAREGTTVTDVEAVDLSNLVERAWGTVSTHDATLVADDLGMEFEADEDRLRQVLENLFRNAIDHGGEDVTVTLERLPDGFAVADDGPGIPAADREDVFEYGYSTSEDGSGYGLAITTDLVEAHGWTVTVTESDAGGARFEISGIGLQTDPHRPETARPDGSGLQH